MTLFLPVLERIFVKQIQILGDLRLPQHLFVFLAGDADHAGNQCGCGGKMVGGEGQTFGVEIIDRQIAVRMNDDRARAFLNRLRVNPIGQPFFDDDRIGEIAFGLGQKIAHGHGSARAGHSQQYGVLRRLIAFPPPENVSMPTRLLDRTVVDGFGGCQVSGERARDGQHVGKEPVFSIEFAMFVTPPGPAGPGLEE